MVAKEGGFIQTAMRFVADNIAYILIVAAVAYFVIFTIQVIDHKRKGTGVTIHLRLFIGFLLVLGVAVYCLVTGTNLSDFIY